MKNTLLLLLLLMISGLVPAEGQELDLTSYEGKVVYLDFWASWCKPCKESFPWMISLQDKYADEGLVVITVNLDRETKVADNFLAKLKSDLPVIYDSEGKLAEQYELEAMPTSFIYGRTGELVDSHIGFSSKEGKLIEQQLIGLLREKNEEE